MARTAHKVNESRTFGIEIEAFHCDKYTLCAALNTAGIACFVESYNHETRYGHWKLVPDGSIMGEQSFELVSPPLRGAAGLAQVQTVCRVLADCGAHVNKSCGLHVHHDANDLTIGQWKNLCKYYTKYEATLDSLLPVSRRANNNSFCASLLGYDGIISETFAKIDRATDLHSLANLLCGQSRYYKLNLMAFWRHGTVEVRHHSGTIEYEKIAAWVSLTQGLLEAARHHRTEEVSTLTAHVRASRAAGMSYRALDHYYHLEGNGNGMASYRLCHARTDMAHTATLMSLLRITNMTTATKRFYSTRQQALAA